MEEQDFQKMIQEEYRNELQRILFYLDEYNKGNKEYEEDLLELLASYKMDMKSAKKYHLLFSLLIFYLDRTIVLTNYHLRSESDYKDLIGYCRSDIKYYLEVSKLLMHYINKCIKEERYEHLDVIFLLTVKLSYVLSGISDYLAYIRNMEEYYGTFISYQIPRTYRDNAALNIAEIEESLKILGLRNEDDV